MADETNAQRLIRALDLMTEQEGFGAVETLLRRWCQQPVSEGADGSTSFGERPAPAPVAVVDGRCDCQRCKDRTGDIYRMVGRCYNCKAEPILMIYRAGDKAAPLGCPFCGCYREVHPSRLAHDDEIPSEAAVDG